MKTRLLIAFLLLALLVGAAALVAQQRRSLLQRLLVEQLRQRGITASLSVERLGLDDLLLRDLRLGDDDALTAAEVELRYSLGGVRFGRLDAMRVVRPTLRAALSGGALSLGSLDALRKPGGTPATSPAQRVAALPLERVEIDGGTLLLRSEAGPIEVRGIDLHAERGADAIWPHGGLRVGSLRVGSGRLPELVFEADFEPAEDGIAVSASLGDARGRASVRASGLLDPERQSLEAALRIEPIALASAGNELLELVPGTGALRFGAGSLEGRGELRLEHGVPRGHVDFGLRDGQLDTGVARLFGVHLVARVDWPLAVPPGQLLSVARVDCGLELTDGLVDFGLDESGALELASASFRFAGGRLRTRGRLDPAADWSLDFDVEGLDLARLLALVEVSDLSGSGRLDGHLPVVRRGKSIEVRRGELHAGPEGGWIRVPAKTLEAASHHLLALQNFHYDSLSVTVDGDPAGEMKLGMAIAGANPDFAGGQPYVFNLNLEVSPAELLGSASVVARVPDAIRRRLAAIAQ